MKCHQCDRPAYFQATEGQPALCIHCNSLLQHANHISFLQNAAMMNHVQDELNSTIGFAVSRSRIPVEHIARAIQGSPSLTSISVSNSQIGVLNTGAIKKIEAAITLSRGSDLEPVTRLIEEMTREIISSSQLQQAAKNEALELTEALSEELVGRRRAPSILAMGKALKERLDVASALAKYGDQLLDLLQAVS